MKSKDSNMIENLILIGTESKKVGFLNTDGVEKEKLVENSPSGIIQMVKVRLNYQI